ncbi:MAG: hypothetical protein JNJ54_07000 [Myxococcaceae bacterium]|nr:hypothetical protein [Myxococcaceae bacterium]
MRRTFASYRDQLEQALKLDTERINNGPPPWWQGAVTRPSRSATSRRHFAFARPALAGFS